MLRALVIEKQSEIRDAIAAARLGDRLTIEAVPSFDHAKQRLRENSFDLVIYDADGLATERSTALERLAQLTRKRPSVKVIVVGDRDGLCRLNPGWESFAVMERPLDAARFLTAIGTAGSQAALAPSTSLEGVMAASLPMRFVLQQVIETAAVDAPVLITGETGTGKDVVAAAIHKRSKRNAHPYVPVNMGAISHELIGSDLFGHEKGAFTGASDSHRGFFEEAQGGTIFLDEITTMDEKTQISLLRVLETNSIRRVGGHKDIYVDTRVIAATNENIEEAVEGRRFRDDLYYRLDVFRIHLPPLRERAGDVTFLTNHFIAHYCTLYNKNIRRAPTETYAMLRSYPWPGNVRELKNVVQRAVVMAKGAELTPDLLPARVREAQRGEPSEAAARPAVCVGMSLEEVEKEFILMTLASVAGNKAKAAAILKISRHTLYDKLTKYGVL